MSLSSLVPLQTFTNLDAVVFVRREIRIVDRGAGLEQSLNKLRKDAHRRVAHGGPTVLAGTNGEIDRKNGETSGGKKRVRYLQATSKERKQAR